MIQIASLHLYLFISGRGFVIGINSASWIERERKSYLAVAFCCFFFSHMAGFFILDIHTAWVLSFFFPLYQQQDPLKTDELLKKNYPAGLSSNAYVGLQTISVPF